MAKRAAKLGRGRKRCPKCGTVVAARAPKCRKCDYEFIKRAAAPVAARVATEQQGIQEVINFIKAHDGVENARRIVEDVRELIAKVGSMDEVLECFNLVSLIRESI